MNHSALASLHHRRSVHVGALADVPMTDRAVYIGAGLGIGALATFGIMKIVGDQKREALADHFTGKMQNADKLSEAQGEFFERTKDPYHFDQSVRYSSLADDYWTTARALRRK